MAIVLAVKKWRHYLMGQHFIIRTDQRSLKYLMDQREVGPEYQKWMYKLLGFDFDIQYKPGTTNKVADALSREFTSNPELGSITSSWSLPLDQLQKEIEADTFIQQVTSDILNEGKTHVGFTVNNRRLLYKGRLVIPQNSTLIPLLLEEFHNSVIGGILGNSRPTSGWQRNGFGSGCVRRSRNMFKGAMNVPPKRQPIRNQQGYSNPYQLRIRFGMKYPWISLRDFPSLKVWILL